jgi:hypothetical protein
MSATRSFSAGHHARRTWTRANRVKGIRRRLASACAKHILGAKVQYMIARANPLTVIAEADWLERQRLHEARVSAWTHSHRARTARGEKHPVYHFLFSYYSFRPAWLRRWHPGPGLGLLGEAARSFLRWPEYRAEVVEEQDVEVVRLELATLPAHRHEFVLWLRTMLAAMQTRPAFFGCHGLHEWAMVYRQTSDEVRHNAYPLRFEPEQLAAIVEAAPITCTHFDAFRFFTAAARPLNKLQPTRTDVAQLEQRGCLHANMDLYKWAFKLAPFTPSELIADCFELARDVREVDMRASPYDLRSLGFEPITVETAAGRAEYERHQRRFAERGAPLRTRN